MNPALVPILFGRPGWVPLGATLAFDFTKGAGWSGGSVKPAAGLLTATTGNGWSDNNAGIYRLFNTNQPRITDKGILSEETRTNVVLHNRDLTNVAWTASNVTAAKTQVGVDGVANSASSITATSSAGTITQAITLGSSARYQSVFAKRLVGAGTLEMSMDGGSTYTDITPAGTDWLRKTIATQTLANPEPRFRLQTSGDSFAIDFVQNENGIFATSPIAVTTVAVTRSADNIAVTSPPALSAGYTLFGQAVPNIAAAANANAQNVVQADAGSGANRLLMRRVATSGGRLAALVGGTGATILTSATEWVAGTRSKWATGVEAGSQASSVDGAAVSATSAATLPTAPTALRIGVNSGATEQFNGYIERIAVFPFRLANAQLQALTA